MMQDELTLDLVRKAAAGDVAAMECLLLRFHAPLLRYLNRRLTEDVRRVVDSQDIIQDIHFEVFRHRSHFTATDAPSALRWLLKLARNRLIDVIRMHRAAKRGSALTLDLGSVNGKDRPLELLLQELAVYERTPSRSAVAHELVGVLERSMARLPADYRQAIHLRYMEGLPVEATAARMGRSLGAIRMLCNRGLRLMREDLQAASFYP